MLDNLPGVALLLFIFLMLLIQHLHSSLVPANLLLALSLTLLGAALVVLLIAVGYWV
jgi:hypothetical protein